MKVIQIKNSYNIWKPSRQRDYANLEGAAKYNYSDATECLNRSWRSIHVEWWLHNIGYYITKPFCYIDWIRNLNMRFKDVDLEEWE